jgi:hypothetical protein
VGRWRSVNGVLVPCRRGLHATTADSLISFLHQSLWRVEIGGEFVWHGSSTGRKLVARRMRIVERVEAWSDCTAFLFAADCAERALRHFEARYPDDTRPCEAIEVARRFARGKATQAELGGAANAAANAARAAAPTAAQAAQAAYAARAAANAACAAAYVADAAANAAAYAADAYAYVAADATAARESERAWQARHLCEMLGLTWDAPESEAAL